MIAIKKGCDIMAIKKRRKLNWYKVVRLMLVLIMMVGVVYHHEYLVEVLTTPEPQQKTVEEMSADYRARLQEKADMELHQKLREEANKKSTAEQEAKLQAQQAEDKARSEKERADFIEHRRDPHGPVTITQ